MLLSLGTFAQIKGRVVDQSTKEALPGATIGTTKGGTTSGLDGTFELKTAKAEFKNVGLGIKKDIVSALKEQGKETGRILDLQKKQLNGSIRTADVEKRISAAKDKFNNGFNALINDNDNILLLLPIYDA